MRPNPNVQASGKVQVNNPVQPKTCLTIGAKTYQLLFDFEAVATAEELVDRPLLTGLRQRDISTPTISLVRAMLFACLYHPHVAGVANDVIPPVTYSEAKALVNRKNLGEVWGKVLSAWTAGLAEADPEEDAVDEDPKTAQS
jgi:hypothetical protein